MNSKDYAVVDADVDLEFLLRRKKTGQEYRFLTLEEARKDRSTREHPERYLIYKVTLEQAE